jgi:hypothetical protein
MAEVVQIIPKDPRDADATLRDVLDDIVERNGLNRTLVRFAVRATEIELVYRPPA